MNVEGCLIYNENLIKELNITDEEFDSAPLYFKDILTGNIKIGDKVIVNGADSQISLINEIAEIVSVERGCDELIVIYVKFDQIIYYNNNPSDHNATFTISVFNINDKTGYVFYSVDTDITFTKTYDVVEF